MEIGRGPLLLIRNQLQCGQCRHRLPGSAAGAIITGEYRGPTLYAVTVATKAGRIIHECDASRPAKPADDTAA